MKAFLIDVAKCNGCFSCQVACKDEHCGADWTPYSKPQPETGQFWIKVNERVRGQVPWVRLAYTPILCVHCGEDAPCMVVAPEGAVYRREDGLVIIDPEKAKGCKEVAEACPLGAVYWNEEREVPQKCTGCAHLLDNGWSVPRCVDVCPTEALMFGEEEDLAEVLSGSVSLPEVVGFEGRVFYKNLPRRFVAGTAVDFDAREVVIGAQVELSKRLGGVLALKRSDEFGDFIFQQVEPGEYVLRIEAEGYQGAILDVDLSERDLSVGDVPMRKL